MQVIVDAQAGVITTSLTTTAGNSYSNSLTNTFILQFSCSGFLIWVEQIRREVLLCLFRQEMEYHYLV